MSVTNAARSLPVTSRNRGSDQTGSPGSITPPLQGASRPDAPSLSLPMLTDEKPCVVDLCADGSAEVIVRVDADILRRCQRRAGNMDLGYYLWQNVFKPGLNSHVY